MVFLRPDNRYFAEKGVLVEHIKAKNLRTEVMQHILPDTGTLAGSFTFGQICRAVPKVVAMVFATLIMLATLPTLDLSSKWRMLRRHPRLSFIGHLGKPCLSLCKKDLIHDSFMGFLSIVLWQFSPVGDQLLIQMVVPVSLLE